MIPQLHLHTEYSLLDGIIKIEDLVRHCEKEKIPAAIITDHGSTAGFPDLHFATKGTNVKPIYGCEFYFYDPADFKKTFHIVLLAKTNVGLKNLLILATKSYNKENFYKKPRINFDLLKKFGKDLVCLTACLGGLIFHPQLGEKYLMLLYDIFGDDLYLEIMEPNDMDVIKTFRRKYKIPIVITSDVHYLFKEDKSSHEIHLASKSKSNFSMKQYTLCYDYVPYSGSILKVAKRNIMEVIEKCNANLKPGKNMPRVNWLQEEEKEKWIKSIVDKKLRKIKKRKNGIYLKRFKYEYDVIKKSGYLDYFIIVTDYVNWARQQGIYVGWGRGSGVGSLMCYLTNITEVDPIKHDLIFERFLNPERPSVPDIDVDFEDERRNEVKNYVAEKYGKTSVVQIGTWGTRGVRSAFRDVARVLRIPQSEIGEILEAVEGNKKASVARYKKNYPDLFKYAEKLKGIKRNFSTHAAGMIISDKSLLGRIPMSYDPDADVYNSIWDMYSLEELGFIKFDILGLKTMTTIKVCERLMIKYQKFLKAAGEEGKIMEYNMANAEIKILDNKGKDKQSFSNVSVYKMLSKGETAGVFEFDGYAATNTCEQVGIADFNDIVAVNALARPGGMDKIGSYIEAKHSGEKYIHPKLKMILKDSRGILLYDDQVMRIVKELANFNPVEVDKFRKAMKGQTTQAKKLYGHIFKEYEQKFINGCVKNKIPRSKAKQIYEQMITFSGYGFNKNHATAYSVITYVTAFIKCHWPLIFAYAFVITQDEKKIERLLDEIKDIKIYPPDINISEIDYTLNFKEEKILKGLTTIKGIGDAAANKIIKLRPYKDFEDFVIKTRGKGIQKQAIIAMINGGVFGKNKLKCKNELEKLLKKPPKQMARKKKSKAVGLWG